MKLPRPRPLTDMPPSWIWSDRIHVNVDAVDMVYLAGVASAMRELGYCEDGVTASAVFLFCLATVADWLQTTGKLEIEDEKEGESGTERHPGGG